MLKNIKSGAIYRAKGIWGTSTSRFCSGYGDHSEKVGKNCHIHPLMNIGINDCSGKVATVGDDVYLSNRCKLIGDIEIGNGIMIAAGAAVTKSFTEENAVIRRLTK